MNSSQVFGGGGIQAKLSLDYTYRFVINVSIYKNYKSIKNKSILNNSFLSKKKKNLVHIQLTETKDFKSRTV